MEASALVKKYEDEALRWEAIHHALSDLHKVMLTAYRGQISILRDGTVIAGAHDECWIEMMAVDGLEGAKGPELCITVEPGFVVTLAMGTEMELTYARMAIARLMLGTRGLACFFADKSKPEPSCADCKDQGGVSSCNTCGRIAPALAGHHRMQAKMFRRHGRDDLADKHKKLAQRLASGEAVFVGDE